MSLLEHIVNTRENGALRPLTAKERALCRQVGRALRSTSLSLQASFEDPDLLHTGDGDCYFSFNGMASLECDSEGCWTVGGWPEPNESWELWGETGSLAKALLWVMDVLLDQFRAFADDAFLAENIAEEDASAAEEDASAAVAEQAALIAEGVW